MKAQFRFKTTLTYDQRRYLPSASRLAKMLTINLILGILGSLAAVSACPDAADGHTHDHSKRTIPSFPLAPPTRPLVWGDVIIINTTDSHGWILGYQKSSFPEPNYRCVFIIS
jgi:hypothetical protein